jgi:tetratricopeptide (TPR) repeat protein
MSNRSAAKRLVLRFAGRLLAVGVLCVGANWCGSSIAHAQPTPAQILAIRPKCEDVTITTPDAAGIAACKLDIVKTPGGGSGFVLKDGNSQVLRKFMDVSGGGRVDQYSYFKDGAEVYRETLTKAGLNIRWIQTGGMKSGIAQQTSAGRIRIVAWQMISAEEAAYEAFQALATGDADRLQAVLITPQEIAQLGLPAADAQKLTAQVAGAAAKLAAVRAKVPEIATAKFARLESAQAGAYPTDITGGANELIKIVHGLILYDNPTAKKQNDFINAPEMIQVGLAWRLTDSPSPDGGPDVDPNYKKALDELAKIDAAHPEGGRGAKVIEWNKARAQATAEVAKYCPANERESWYKQVVDGYATATSLKDAESTTTLSKIKESFVASQKGGSLAAYVTYREIWALYQAAAETAKGTEFVKVQTQYHDALKKFVIDYSKAEDAPDALIQLAMGGEFTSKDEEAKKYYQQIVENFPSHPNRPKAEGAIRRLDSVGKALDLTSPVLGNPAQRFSMNQVAGKVTVVYYWSTLSAQAGPDFAVLGKLQAANAKDVAIVCVNLDETPADADAFAKKNATFATHLTQPVGTNGQTGGMNGPLATQYGIFGLPQVFLVGANGLVVSNKIQINQLDDEIEKLTKK